MNLNDLLQKRISFPKGGFKFDEHLDPVSGSVTTDDAALAASLASMTMRLPAEPNAFLDGNLPPRFLDGKPVR